MTPGARVLLDSSAVLAVLDAADANHGEALRTATDLARQRCRLFQTSFLRVETHALLLARLGADAARRWLVAPRPPTLRPEPGDEARGESVVRRCRDKEFSLCDAIAFAVMERVRARAAFTFDRHFRQYGFDAVP
jgi:predicted nucleic acid-binding protein